MSRKSKKQHTVSSSSAEAEYRALSCAASELLWLKGLLLHFEIQANTAMVFCDSQAAIHLASNPTFHERSKHVEIDCHFIREHVNSGFLQLVHVWTHHQLVYLLTKAVTSTQFHSLMPYLGALDIFAPA